MCKSAPICLAISLLLNSPSLMGISVFAQQQNLMPGAEAAHLPVDQDDDNLPETVRHSNETVEESVSPRGSAASAAKINHGNKGDAASSSVAKNGVGSAGSSSVAKNGVGSAGSSSVVKNSGVSATGAGTGSSAPARKAVSGLNAETTSQIGGASDTASAGHDPNAFLKNVAKSFDTIMANGGHAPVKLRTVAKSPNTIPVAVQTPVAATQPTVVPQEPSATTTSGAKPPAVPQLSSLRNPVWRETSSAEETVEPEHDGAADTMAQPNAAGAAGSTTDGAKDTAAKDGGTSGVKLAMAGSTEPKAIVIEYSQVDLIPKLFKRSALILDAQAASGHVSKEQLAKIVAATPPLTYKSKADKAREAADKVAAAQGNRQPSNTKLDPRQTRKTGSSVLLTPAVVSFDLDEVLRALKRENSLIDLKSIGETITTLRRAVTDHPSEPSLRIKLGSILLLAGDYDGAANEMKHAIAFRPKDYRAHLLLAHILDDVGDHEIAASEFRRAIELAPNAPEPHSLYADSLVYQGDISAAINEYRRAIGVKPNADALSGLAEALFIAQDKIGSLKAARQAVSLDPSSAKAHVALTKALILNGDQAASMRTARQAVLLSPSLADSHIALGRALHAKGDLDGAVDEFKQAVTLDPLNAQARNDLGYALYSKGDILGAVGEFRISLRLNPRLGEARNNLEIAIHRLSGRKAP